MGSFLRLVRLFVQAGARRAGVGQAGAERHPLARRPCGFDETSWTRGHTAITAMILWDARITVLNPSARLHVPTETVNALVRVQLIEEAGHLPGIERSEFVTESILEFVSEHRGLDAIAQR